MTKRVMELIFKDDMSVTELYNTYTKEELFEALDGNVQMYENASFQTEMLMTQETKML